MVLNYLFMECLQRIEFCSIESTPYPSSGLDEGSSVILSPISLCLMIFHLFYNFVSFSPF